MPLLVSSKNKQISRNFYLYFNKTADLGHLSRRELRKTFVNWGFFGGNQSFWRISSCVRAALILVLIGAQNRI